MDFAVLLSPFLAVLTPITLDAIRKASSSREERTKRMQHCIALLDFGSRPGMQLPEDIQLFCKQELSSIHDEVRNHGDKMTGFLATVITGTIFLTCILVFDHTMQVFLNSLAKAWQAQPHELVEKRLQELWLANLLIETSGACVCWFWLRWKIRDRVWQKLRPGSALNFLSTMRPRFQAALQLVILLAMLFALRFFIYMLPVRQ